MLTFSFPYHKITLFENKYDNKLITLISMYHLKHFVSLQVQLKCKLLIDTFQILFIEKFYRRFVYF